MNISWVGTPVLAGAAPNAAAMDKLLAAPVIPQGLIDKQGRALAPLCAEVAAAGENPVLILPLGMEDPDFSAAVLGEACGWAAAGAALAAKAAGASELIIYAAAGQAGDALGEAMGQYGLQPRVVTGEGSAVLREESALYSVLDGKAIRSELLDKAFPTQGWQGRPTLVLDIETGCWLAALATGAAEKQGKLMAGIAMANPDAVKLAELALGSSLDAAVNAFGVTTEKPLLMGGITGFVAPVGQLASTDLTYTKDFDTLRSFDSSICMAQVGARLTSEIEAMSCGKCVLCREGSWQFKAAFAEFPEGKGKKADFELVPDIGELIAIGAFCSYGRDMVRVPIGLMRH
ncbi:hypothetical protein LJC60_09980, partial [Ruminococcaceae bacterium OttesenSCG-928-D13]|nr:hypothetical protein [Ruminococcaceae bacterium OttesenSCG-928-D13]